MVAPEIGRFKSPQKLVSYFGLNPRVRQSGLGAAYVHDPSATWGAPSHSYHNHPVAPRCARLTVQMTFLSSRGTDEAAQIP